MRLTALVFSTLIAAGIACTQQEPPAYTKPWKIRIASEKEPGKPIIVFGKLKDAKGNPVVGAKVHIFHADNTGEYGNTDERKARLSGTLWTDAQGRYEFRSIRPAPYPGQKHGQHFHMLVTGAGIEETAVTLAFWDDQAEKITLAVNTKNSKVPKRTDFVERPDSAIQGTRVQVDFVLPQVRS